MQTKYKKFHTQIMDYYHHYGRHSLPWRKNYSPYFVTVSEIMLQQTQVDRVIPFFHKWMKQFPNWKQLAQAPQSQVLKYWKGLGYNSRALRLHKLAQIITKEYAGKLPKEYQQLVALPGIGPYTAGAILAFAYNIYIPCIETNIRRVFIYHFLKEKSNVSDTEIFEHIKKIGNIESPREWYAALMDYGSFLAKEMKHNPNTQSKHYKKQPSFKGSDREIRGKILEIFLEQHSLSKTKLFNILGTEHVRYEKILKQLVKEKFLTQTKTVIFLK